MTVEGGEHAGFVAPFDIAVSGAPDDPIVAVRGELDVATSPELRVCLGKLLDRGATRITLDFRDVSFVDSSGLGVLVGAYKRLKDLGSGSIRIMGTQPSVRKVFEITGLQSALLDD